jgi:hypothetical protein
MPALCREIEDTVLVRGTVLRLPRICSSSTMAGSEGERMAVIC